MSQEICVSRSWKSVVNISPLSWRHPERWQHKQRPGPARRPRAGGGWRRARGSWSPWLRMDDLQLIDLIINFTSNIILEPTDGHRAAPLVQFLLLDCSHWAPSQSQFLTAERLAWQGFHIAENLASKGLVEFNDVEVSQFLPWGLQYLGNSVCGAQQ